MVPSHEHVYTHMTLNLWSIDPNEMLAGKSMWRFEGTLLARRGTHVSVKQNLELPGFSDFKARYLKGDVNDNYLRAAAADGMHPGGSVVDMKNKVEHVFIYLGFTMGPSGIFRVTRTLDTSKLREWLEKNPSEYWK